MKANVLLVFNRNPYDGTDVTWNGLRLAEQLLHLGMGVNIFLMNDSVDLARDAAKPAEGYFDLGQMLKDFIAKNVPVKVCGTPAKCDAGFTRESLILKALRKQK